jgi:hypothetical protein
VQISKEANSDGKIAVEITGTADQTFECNKLIRELLSSTNPAVNNRPSRGDELAIPNKSEKQQLEPLPAPDW